MDIKLVQNKNTDKTVDSYIVSVRDKTNLKKVIPIKTQEVFNNAEKVMGPTRYSKCKNN